MECIIVNNVHTVVDGRGTLFYLTTCSILHWDCFVWQQVARSYSSWLWVEGPHISIHCIAVNIGLYLPCVKRVLAHRHASHLPKTLSFRFLQQCSRGLHSYEIWCHGTGWLVSSGIPRVGGFKPPPKIPKFWQSCIWLQIERKMFSVPIPTS